MQNAPAPLPHASGVAVGQLHTLLAHCWPAGQALPQLPQLLASLVVSAQYVGFTDGHALCVETQPTAHWPFEQSSPDLHALPHAPQLAGSFWKLVQNAPAPLPHALGVAVGQLHVLLAHCWPAGQALPQLPQLLASLVVSAQ